MAKIVSIPPSGFENLTPDEKVEYVQDLWDYVVADASKVPVPDWHRSILHERSTEHQTAPDEGDAWPRVRDRGRQPIFPTETLIPGQLKDLWRFSINCRPGAR
jgi:putative addiction module component (TIGR02574 family)